MSWLAYALMTVVCWGLYGVALHTGQIGMEDPVHGRYKAFLFVGIAYFLIAVIAPAALLQTSGATWDFPTRGAAWSLGAGAVGAIGAFCVLLAAGIMIIRNQISLESCRSQQAGGLLSQEKQ